MRPLGFQFDVDAVVLDGTADTTACPRLSPMLPSGATTPAAGETYWVQCCPRECSRTPPFQTLLSYKGEPAERGSVR
jgi:hypothetical protein